MLISFKNKFLHFLTVSILLLIIQDGIAQDRSTQVELEKSFFYAARTSDMILLKKFLDAGVDVNYQGENGYTALMIAAYNGQLKAVKFFLSKDANLCLKDKRGNTALMGAIVTAEDTIAKLLISKSNCDKEVNKRTIEFASRFKRTHILELLKSRK